MKKWHVYEAEYQEEGSVLIEAETAEEAMAKYREMTGTAVQEEPTELGAIEATEESAAAWETSE